MKSNQSFTLVTLESEIASKCKLNYLYDLKYAILTCNLSNDITFINLSINYCIVKMFLLIYGFADKFKYNGNFYIKY